MAAGESQEWMGEKLGFCLPLTRIQGRPENRLKVGRGRRVGVSLGHDLY
jgi:hypothetical protein